MHCPYCGADNLDDTVFCVHCGQPVKGAARRQEGDSTGGIIPYKNPQALIAYYCGIFSVVPCIGLPLGIAGLVLGVLGLQARKRNPAISGTVHAGIGIGCGLIGALFWGAMTVLFIIGLLAQSK